MKGILEKAKIAGAAFFWRIGTTYLRGKGLQKVWPFGYLYRTIDATLKHHEWPEVYEIDGHRIAVPGQFRAAFAVFGGEREADTRRLFEREIPRGTAVVDVGANIGMHTLTFARCVGPEGKVFAFEPGPDNLVLLRKNVAMNNYANVDIVPKAVGERAGTVRLYMSEANPGDHRSYDPQERLAHSTALTKEDKSLVLEQAGLRPSVEVQMVSLDEFMKGEKRPVSLVKIDVQGSEGAVIAGMRGLLQANPDIKLHFELWPAGMRLYGTDPAALLYDLERMGFAFYDANEDAFRLTKHATAMSPISPGELMVRCKDNRSTDVFAKRRTGGR